MNRKFNRGMATRAAIKTIAYSVSATLAASAASVSLGLPVMAEEMSIFDTSKALRYAEFNAKNPVSDATLFLGTYIIPLSQFNETNRASALKTMAASGQTRFLYKSELGDGEWFEYDTLEGLHGLTGEDGTPVPQEDIDKLYVEYYITADGVCHEAVSGVAVSLFDNPSPYDLTQIPELQTLYQIYKGQFSPDNSEGMDLYYYEKLSEFFSPESSARLHTAETDKLDSKLKSLMEAYNNYQSSGNKEKAGVISGIMEQIDSERRAIVYDRLAIYEAGVSLLDELNTINEEETYNSWCEDNKYISIDDLREYYSDKDNLQKAVKSIEKKYDLDHDDNVDYRQLTESNYDEFLIGKFDQNKLEKVQFVVNTTVRDEIYNAIGSCSTALTDCLKKSLSDPETILGTADYNKKLEIIASPAPGAALDGLVDDVIYIKNISNNVVSEKTKEQELILLDSQFLPLASDNYQAALLGGAGSKLTVALTNAVTTESRIRKAIEEQGSELNSKRTELEFLITAKRKRTIPKVSFTYCQDRIDWTDTQRSSIPSDEFQTTAITNATAHINWLTTQMEELKREDSELLSELDKMRQQLEEMRKKLQKAMDENDANAMKKQQALIDALNKKLAEAERRAKNKTGKSASEQAADKISGAGTEDGARQAMEDAITEKEAMGEDASDEKTNLEDMKALEEQENAGEGGDGGNLPEGALTSAGELTGAIENMFGNSFENLDGAAQIEIISALDDYGQEGCLSARRLAAEYIEKCKSNIYVFKTRIIDQDNYGSIKAVAAAAGYRYLYESYAKRHVMLSKKNINMSFTRYSDKISIEGAESIKMERAADYFENTIYIVESAVKTQFGCRINNIEDSKYSVILNKKMNTKAEKLYNVFIGNSEE